MDFGRICDRIDIVVAFRAFIDDTVEIFKGFIKFTQFKIKLSMKERYPQSLVGSTTESVTLRQPFQEYGPFLQDLFIAQPPYFRSR